MRRDYCPGKFWVTYIVSAVDVVWDVEHVRGHEGGLLNSQLAGFYLGARQSPRIGLISRQSDLLPRLLLQVVPLAVV